MKKRELKRKLEIATEALKLYRGYMINGILYADKALSEIDTSYYTHIHIQNNDKLRKEIADYVLNIIKREVSR